MFEFDTVRAMTLFVSGSCNLNCSYCYIHKNPALKIIDKEIKNIIIYMLQQDLDTKEEKRYYDKRIKV